MKIIIFTFLFVVSILACTPSEAPPVFDEISTSSHSHGKVVWYNLASPSPDISKNFYETVFGWTTEEYGENNKRIWIFRNNNKPVGLMAHYKSDKNTGEWIGSISVDNIYDVSAMAKSMNAKILNKPLEIKNQGTFSFIEDPQGANFALIKFKKGDPDTKLSAYNTFLGMELWSNNTVESKKFYTDVIGYNVESKKVGNVDLTIFKKNDLMCAGMQQNPVEGVRSHWMPYIRVSNLQNTFEKAVENGATVLMEPNKNILNGSIAIIMDPTGAPVALQVYNP